MSFDDSQLCSAMQNDNDVFFFQELAGDRGGRGLGGGGGACLVVAYRHTTMADEMGVLNWLSPMTLIILEWAH